MFTTLRSKIYAGFAAIIAINVVFGLWSIYQFRGVGESIDRTITPNFQVATTAIRLVTAADEELSLIEKMAVTRGGELVAPMFDKLSQIRGLVNSVQYDSLEAYRGIMPEIRSNVIALQQTIASFQDSMRLSRGDLQPILNSELRPAVAALRRNCLQLLTASRNEMYRSQNAIDRESSSALFLVAVSAVVTAILGVIGGGIYSRWAVKPINRLNLAVKNLSGGRLGDRIVITSADELGDLTFEFNRMIERLHHYDTLNIEQLLIEKRKVETIVQSIATPIIVVNAEMNTLLLNYAAATIFRLPISERFEGRPIAELIDDRVVLKALERAVRHDVDGAGGSPDIFVLTEEGADRFFAVQALPLETTSTVSGAVAVFSDITHFKELDRLKSDFIAKVSHEFRTPLSSIMMSTDILREGIVGPVNEAQRDLLAPMKEDCRRLSKLITDLLELSRLESNARVPICVQIDVPRLVESVLQPHLVIASEKKVLLAMATDVALPPIWADPEEFRWIINNLVSNALRHTDSGGSITVRTIAERDPGGVPLLTISVADNGHGIPMDSLGMIFDKFYQVGSSSISTPGSVGLGLAITREVVESYGGRISVVSELHHGSTFTVKIPFDRLARPADIPTEESEHHIHD